MSRPKPLKGQRIETKPKRVTHFSKFKDEIGATKDARLLLEFNELVDCISNGWEVPDQYYRLKVDEDKDLLLERTGIKHLHLGGRASNNLVYLLEFPENVILLRISDHAYLEDDPRGSLIRKTLGL